MLTGKTVVLGVTGSIAAYKIANLASMLVKQHADVHVIMTKNACNFITPITFETLTHNKCLVDTFDRNFEFKVEHVSLAQKADIFLIAPATANIIGKLANGICDDMLTTTVCATRKPVLVSPAMNTGMFENPVVQDNLSKLQHYGYHIIEPATGHLACGDTGKGKMPSEDTLFNSIKSTLQDSPLNAPADSPLNAPADSSLLTLHSSLNKDLSGKKVLITAGPTQEAIDPVRYITNHSSGKMGYALAKMALLRGAEVTLVSGPTSLKPFETPETQKSETKGISLIPVISAEDMFNAVTEHSQDNDIIIMCAAVADYTPLAYHDQKMKKHDGDLTISLKRTQDILAYLGEHKAPGQILVGFSMETENLIDNSSKKLVKKNADFICANTISAGNTGFGVDTNKVTIISKDAVKELPLCSKEETANLILYTITENP